MEQLLKRRETVRGGVKGGRPVDPARRTTQKAGEPPGEEGNHSPEEICRAFFGRMTRHSASGNFCFSKWRNSEKLTGEITSKDVSYTDSTVQPLDSRNGTTSGGGAWRKCR